MAKNDDSVVKPGDSTAIPVKPAEFSDTPSWGKRIDELEFETFAIAKNGTGGEVLGGIKWGVQVDDKLKVTPLKVEPVRDYQDFKDAVAAWNKQAEGPMDKRNHPDQELLGPFTYPK
jgi:hypothetical protein